MAGLGLEEVAVVILEILASSSLKEVKFLTCSSIFFTQVVLRPVIKNLQVSHFKEGQ